MPTDQERIAVLEAENAHVSSMLEEVRADVKTIKARLAQQTGFIAGAACVASLVWAALGFVVSNLWDRLGS